MPEQLTYLMHIPKTAGMSLQKIVRKRYKLDRELFLVYDKTARKQGFKDDESLKVVMGHFPYGYHQFSKRTPRYFTFLRNPKEHFISNYFYFKEHPDKYPNLDASTTLEDFATNGPGYNFQTRYVSGILKIKGREQEALDLAKKNLTESIQCIGLTEKFDQSLLMMGKALGWKNFFYQKANEGKKRKQHPPISKADWETISNANRYDEELYTFAQNLFEVQKKRYPSIERETRIFKLKNDLFWKINPLYTRLKVALGLEKIPIARR